MLSPRWFFYVSYAFKYIFNMSFLSILGIFSSTEEQVIYPIIARFGIFIYSTFVPLLMIWRQKPLRDELLATLRIAKSRVSDFTTSMFSQSNFQTVTVMKNISWHFKNYKFKGIHDLITIFSCKNYRFNDSTPSKNLKRYYSLFHQTPPYKSKCIP